MDLIDRSFASLSEWTKNTLPAGEFTNLIAEGIIPGLSGIAIFIPQIAFLFLFISFYASNVSEMESILQFSPKYTLEEGLFAFENEFVNSANACRCD